MKSYSSREEAANMKDFFTFPAIFQVADDGISITFPDLPGCLPCADTMEDAFANAKEALQLHLYGMEEDSEPIPEPSPNQLPFPAGSTPWQKRKTSTFHIYSSKA